MAYRVLEVTIQSAKDLKRVNLISRMEVYAVVTISGDPMTRQCTPPDPYGGRHPCWNATFRFNVPPTAAAAASGCLHVLLRTERALGDRDVGEVIVPLADVLAGTTACDPGPRPQQQCASYQVRKVHRCEARGTLNVSYRLGPVVALAPPQAPAAAPAPARVEEHGGPVVAYYPMARPFYPSPYGYGYLQPPALPPPPPHAQAAAGWHDADAVRQHAPSARGPINNASYNNFPAAYSPAAAAGGHDNGVHPPTPSTTPDSINTYNNNPAAYSHAGGGYAAAALPPTRGSNSDDDGKKVDFGVGGLSAAGLVSGAIGGMLASDMMAEAAAYSYGYRAGLADGGGRAAAMYKNSHVSTKVQDKVNNSNRRMV